MATWQQLAELTLSTEQIRRVDQIAIDKFHMSSLVLMENAALGCVNWLVNRFVGKERQERDAGPRTTILCGRGNNAGDGLAIARHLRARGWPCTVAISVPPDRLSADSLANLRILTAVSSEGISFFRDSIFDNSSPSPNVFRQELLASDLIVDAMLGTGAAGALRPPLDAWCDQANSSTASRVAIDMPTGIDSESGHAYPNYFRADATLTFVARKPAMLRDASLFGEISVLPIGLPCDMIAQVLQWPEFSC
ncbi:MAG: NAD(P)H-hydrate epimerase [Planctomycetales bacterium]|nr:NAD(P)H-hydrate epimerase [Planctomycetales bacterium]